jgi:hypothetical protein
MFLSVSLEIVRSIKQLRFFLLGAITSISFVLISMDDLFNAAISAPRSVVHNYRRTAA